MISLPSKWLKENKLDKGDEINLQEAQNSLVISVDELKQKKETEIFLKELSETSIRTIITNTYRKGYDKIIVNFENEDQFKILEDTIRTKLIGFDIVKKEKNKCIVENITEPSSDQFDNILEKMFMNISVLFDLTEEKLGGKKPEENYEEVEKRIMQYDNFCRRVLSKRVGQKNIEFFWTFLHLIDHGQREIYHLNNVFKAMKVSQSTKNLLEDCEKVFNLIKESYLKKDLNLLSKIHPLTKELIYKKGYSLLEKSNGKETIIIYHILSSIRKFFQANSPLTGLIL